MSKPTTNPRLRCTSDDFIENEFPHPIVPRIVIRLSPGIRIEFSADFPPRLLLHQNPSRGSPIINL